MAHEQGVITQGGPCVVPRKVRFKA
jgi:hypothetical protein